MAGAERAVAQGTAAKRGMSWAERARPWLWVLPCVVLVAFGAAWRVQTFHVSDYVHIAFGRLAYSDILALYGGHNLAAHHIPYVQQTDIEYPVVMGLVMWLTALVPSLEGYFWANAALLVLCAAGSVLILARLIPVSGLWRFALAPMLWSYGALNWDLLAILELVASIYFIERKRFGWAGGMLALGTWTKLYPGFALPIVLAYSLRAVAPEGDTYPPPGLGRLRRDSPTTRLLIAFAEVTVVLNLPFVIANYGGWAYAFQHQAARDINPDAIWNHIPNIQLHLVNLWFPALFGFGILWLTLRTWWGGRWDAGMLLSILVFLLFTKDYSPQYDIWILPFLTFLLCPLWLWLAYTIADLAYYVGVFWWYYHDYGGTFPFSMPNMDNLLGATVWGRETALVLVAAWALTRFVGLRMPAWGPRRGMSAQVE